MTNDRLLSVIIATRNHARFLPSCFDALAQLEGGQAQFEVIAVDNGSSDDTPEVLQSEARRKRLSLRCITELRAGAAASRNTGVAHARGRYVVFLDDDACVVPGWLKAYQQMFFVKKHALVQGRIEPRFEGSCPSWLTDRSLQRYGRVEQGDTAAPWRGTLRSGNLGITREAFERVGGFRSDLGPGASGLGDDTEFGLRAAAAGFQPVYAPEALMYHLIPRTRVTRTAFLRRSYLVGLSQPLFQQYDESVPRMLLHLGRLSLKRLVSAVVAADSETHMAELCDLAEHLGRVMQILRQKLRG